MENNFNYRNQGQLMGSNRMFHFYCYHFYWYEFIYGGKVFLLKKFCKLDTEQNLCFIFSYKKQN